VVDAGTAADHTGAVTARVGLRITDRGSGALPVGGSEQATVSDLSLDVPVQCAATPGPEGGTCSASTTVDALMPGAVVEGDRAVWALGQVQVLDAAQRAFLRQGIFIP
jgi:hypothetical protein